jgi:hypothetical protein
MKQQLQKEKAAKVLSVADRGYVQPLSQEQRRNCSMIRKSCASISVNDSISLVKRFARA